MYHTDCVKRLYSTKLRGRCESALTAEESKRVIVGNYATPCRRSLTSIYNIAASSLKSLSTLYLFSWCLNRSRKSNYSFPNCGSLHTARAGATDRAQEILGSQISKCILLQARSQVRAFQYSEINLLHCSGFVQFSQGDSWTRMYILKLCWWFVCYAQAATNATKPRSLPCLIFFQKSFLYVYASCIGKVSGFLICMPLLLGIAWFSVFESFAGSCKCLVAAGLRSACRQRSKHVITATIMYPPACASHEIKSASWKIQSLKSRLYLSGTLRRYFLYLEIIASATAYRLDWKRSLFDVSFTDFDVSRTIQNIRYSGFMALSVLLIPMCRVFDTFPFRVKFNAKMRPNYHWCTKTASMATLSLQSSTSSTRRSRYLQTYLSQVKKTWKINLSQGCLKIAMSGSQKNATYAVKSSYTLRKQNAICVTCYLPQCEQATIFVHGTALFCNARWPYSHMHVGRTYICMFKGLVRKIQPWPARAHVILEMKFSAALRNVPESAAASNKRWEITTRWWLACKEKRGRKVGRSRSRGRLFEVARQFCNYAI